jgi:hypothetical protein
MFNSTECADKEKDSKYETNLKFFLDCIILLLVVLLLTLLLFRSPFHASYLSITSSNRLDEPSVDNVLELLANLDEIALDNSGSRSVANGHSASVDFVLGQLEHMNERYFLLTEPVSHIGLRKFPSRYKLTANRHISSLKQKKQL